MSSAIAINTDEVRKWIEARRDLQAIEKELTDKGLDAESIAAHIKEFKRLRYVRRQSVGFVLIAVGAALGLISCVLTLMSQDPELYGIILYGLTSLGILVIFAGFYMVFQ